MKQLRKTESTMGTVESDNKHQHACAVVRRSTMAAVQVLQLRLDRHVRLMAFVQDMNVHKGILGAAPWRLVPQRSTLRAASSVLAMSSSLCAALTKPASYSAGAKYTPRSSMPWKKRLKRSLSVAITAP